MLDKLGLKKIGCVGWYKSQTLVNNFLLSLSTSIKPESINGKTVITEGVETFIYSFIQINIL